MCSLGRARPRAERAFSELSSSMVRAEVGLQENQRAACLVVVNGDSEGERLVQPRRSRRRSDRQIGAERDGIGPPPPPRLTVERLASDEVKLPIVRPAALEPARETETVVLT